jgi:putative hydrolase of the HAD superfamily
MLKLIAFDLDDTLYPETDYVRSGFADVAELLAQDCHLDTETVYRQLWALFLEEPDRVFQRILGMYRPQSVGLESLLECYREHAPRIALPRETRSVLDQLRYRVKLALITDGRLSAQQRKVRALGLEEYFDCICYTDALGKDAWKPSTRGFIYTLDAVGVIPGDAAYVGDNPAKDFVAPNRLGMTSVHLLQPHGIHRNALPTPGGEPRLTINAITETLSLLQ